MPVRRSTKRLIGEPDTPRRRNILPGRQTRPGYMGYFNMLPYTQGIPRRRYERYDITKFENSYLTASQLLKLLPDLSPDVGLALWNILRLGSDGFSYTVKDNQGQDDESGKAILDQLIDRINSRGGGLDGLIVQWLMSGFLQGAVAGEVALLDGLSDVDDFYAVDPYMIESRIGEDGKIAYWFIPRNGGLQVQLNMEKFWYVPIDPMIDDPYGRPPAAPVLQEIWFDIALITDLRRVVHNQGWPRIDIKVLEEVMVNAAPAEIKTKPAELRNWLNDRLADVQAAYNDLQPDDSFVHFDSVEVEQAGSNSSLFDPTAVVRAIERRVIKSLKQLPILMCSNEGTTETHGTIQWQIFVAGLRSLQSPIGFVLSKMLQLALEVQGYQGRVECWFEPIRTTDRKADAEAEKLEIQNAITKWAAGWQTWEESAIEATGSAPPPEATEPDPSLFGAVTGGTSGLVEQVSANSSSRIDAELYSLR